MSGTSNTAVTWACSAGSITPEGLFTAPSTPGTATITATSAADLTKSASVKVAIVATAEVALSVSPATASLNMGAVQTFTATVTGTANTAVTWSCSAGSITSEGVFTAPTNSGLVTITATSVADATKSASAQVTVTAAAGVAVSVSPATASLNLGAVQAFTATVTGTSNTAVTWACSAGSITSAGVFTAPATPGTVTITATSVADATQFASAQVSVTGAVSVPRPSIVSFTGKAGTNGTVLAFQFQDGTGVLEPGLGTVKSGDSVTVNPAVPTTYTLTVQDALGRTVHQSVAVGLRLDPVHSWAFDEGPDWHDSPFQSVSDAKVARDEAGGADANLVQLGASAWVSGRQFTALAFDGKGYLQLSSDLSESLGATSTLAFWLRTSQKGASDTPTCVTGGLGSQSLQWGWMDAGGCIGLGAAGRRLAFSASPINDDQWHHVALTRDAVTGQVQVFVDGALSASGSGPTGGQYQAFSTLGRVDGASGSPGLVGRLDQVTVFDRILSADEVHLLMTNHAPKTWDQSVVGASGRAFRTPSFSCRAYDPERDTLTVKRWTQPAHGSVALESDGSFTYTPSGYIGSDAFDVVVQDGAGGFHRSTMTVKTLPDGQAERTPAFQFTGFAALQVNGQPISQPGLRIPRAMDWNGDGLMDLLVGAGGNIWLYLNTGTPQAPAFSAPTKVQAGGSDLSSGWSSSPFTLVDVDGDGAMDLILMDAQHHLRIYRNTAGPGRTPSFDGYTLAKNADGTDFTSPDNRFDVADWDGDGVLDLVTGTGNGNMLLWPGVGAKGTLTFGASQSILSGSYNLYPRLYDLCGSGLVEFFRGNNWGSLTCWTDPGVNGVANGIDLTVQNPDGTKPDLHALTDGPVVDFADFNGDGIPDLLIGGHAGDQVFLALGQGKSIQASIHDIEAIYDAHPSDLGTALDANSSALLKQINAAHLNLVSYLQTGSLATREALVNELAAHIARYPFLRWQKLDTTQYHNVPSIVAQNWILLAKALPDNLPHRTRVADILGLSGPLRETYLESGLVVGDNAASVVGVHTTIRDFLRRHPRALFPDTVMTVDSFYGDGSGGIVWRPDGGKNVFGDWAFHSANEYAGDLTTAIEAVMGKGSASGEYFSFVMGHEVSHSLPAYVTSRANKDLYRRHGQMLTVAGGPDVVPGADGWIDWTATKANFQAKGYWDGASTTWDTAWDAYFTTGPAQAWSRLSWMRGNAANIGWFLKTSQESLATQGNNHFANGPGRLIGAVDRFRRATTLGLPTLKANINEVVTFIDFISVGLNRVNLVETKYQANPRAAIWTDHLADLERDDKGWIRRIIVDGRTYNLTLDDRGVVVDVQAP